MSNEGAKTIIIRHSDLDGYGSEVVLRSAGWFNVVEVIEAENYNVDDIINNLLDEGLLDEYESKFIVDLSISEATAERLNGVKNVRLYDHHKSSLCLNKYDWCVVRTEYNGESVCATKLLHETFSRFNSDLEPFVETVNKYDTWLWKVNNFTFAVEFNDWFLHMKDKVNWTTLMVDRIKKKYLLTDEDLNIIDEIQREKEEYFSKIFKDVNTKTIQLETEKGIEEFNVGYVYVQNPKHNSLLGDVLCEKDRSIDFIAIINDKWVSLRTIKEGIDLSYISKLNFAGGGHPKSSGCEFVNFKSFI